MLVLAHRGASAYAPENTLAAFRLAIEMGADYVELDVQATRDGELVVVHDPVRTTLAELRSRRPDVPRFADVLDLCAGRIGLAIELKHPALHRRHALTERVVRLIGEHAIEPDSVLVLSFDPDALLETRRLRPDLRLVQHVRRVAIRRAAEHAWGVGFEDAAARPRGIALARSLGLVTTVYTVNDAARMRELAALGVDGIYTDRPDVLRQVLSEPRAPA